MFVVNLLVEEIHLRTSARLFSWLVLSLGLAALVGLLRPAAAQSYSGTTVGGPTFNRPIADLSGLSGIGTNVAYSQYDFAVNTPGYYNFLSTATAPSGWDNFLVLYMGGFNPNDGLNNAYIANDDLRGTTGLSGFNNVFLDAGSYQLVTTGFYNESAGAFTNTITQSQASNFSGTTANAPTFNRPIANGTDPPDTLSSVGTNVRYAVNAFSVSADGTYTFLSDSTAAGWDNYTFLYGDGFDPNNPLNNVLIGNDDYGPLTFGLSGFDADLLAGRSYFFVTTGFENTDFGAFTTTIVGPGTVVPEPGVLTWALAACAPCAFLLRRRTRR